MADVVNGKWVPRPGWRFQHGSTTRFERVPEERVVEPADPDWWKRPYAGKAPPEGAKPGRPWFAPSADVWVDEAGWRWPVSALPRGAQLPAQPSGEEPLEGLSSILSDVERRYWNEKDDM